MEQTSNGAYIPSGFYAKKIAPNPSASTVIVQAESSEYATELASALEEYCADLSGSAYSVNVMSMQTMIDQMNEIITTMGVMLSAIAAISLLVGGIGVHYSHQRNIGNTYRHCNKYSCRIRKRSIVYSKYESVCYLVCIFGFCRNLFRHESCCAGGKTRPRFGVSRRINKNLFPKS